MTEPEVPEEAKLVIPNPAQLAARIRARSELVSRQIRLPDDALVMRGGTLQRADLLLAVERARVELGRPGISIYAADVNSPADLLNAKPMLQNQLSFTRVGRLRGRNFEIEQTFDWPHHTAWLPPDDAEDDGYWVQMFQQAFDRPIPKTQAGSYRVAQH